MIKLTLSAAAFLVAVSTSALAAAQVWNITEVAESVSGAQGQWHLAIEGDKVTGKASMQSNTGAMTTYDLEGSIKGPEFTLTMSNRSDQKKGCVVTGQSKEIEGQTSRRVIGKVNCDGNVKFYVQGGYVPSMH
jgi:hypothetical protein